MKMAGCSEYEALEKEFAKFAGYRYGVAVNSGTAALHLSLVALGVGPGDEVLVPDFTMAACGFAVAYTGAKVVTVDCNPDGLMNLDDAERKVTDETKVIMPVHIYGRLVDMDAVNKLAKKFKLKIVEDACEVHGAEVGPADATCFSFYQNKIVHGEEGGMILTDDKKLANDLRDLKSMAFGEEHDFFHERIGFNYRMPESQAGKVRRSLAVAEENLLDRREVEGWYKENLIDIMPPREVVWCFDLLAKSPEHKERILNAVPGARSFFKPLSTMPMFEGETNPITKMICDVGLYLPVNPRMTKEEVDKICKKVIEIQIT